MKLFKKSSWFGMFMACMGLIVCLGVIRQIFELRSYNSDVETAPLSSTNSRHGESFLQNLVNEYFDGVIVPSGNNDATSLESTVIRCDGDQDLNATCLFSNIYVHEGSTTPHAYVIRGSETSLRFKNLPRLQYYGTYDGDDKIIIDEYDSQENLVTAARDAVRYSSDLTAAFFTYWPQNIGHGIFDGIWGIFVGMVRMGLKDDAPFHPYLVKCLRDDEGEFGTSNWGEIASSKVYRAISLEDSLSVCEHGRLGSNYKSFGGSVRFPLFIHGNGHLGARNFNGENEIPGGRIALQKFRDRVFTGFGIAQREDRTCPGQDTKLKAVIFDNKRYTIEERDAIKKVVSQSRDLTSVSIRFIDWSDRKSIYDQLQLVADTDIYVSGPGTGVVFSSFLNDGSIVVNLGDKKKEPSDLFPYVSYMDEYFASASPHLRALYYDRCLHPEVTFDELMKLILEADKKARSCFDTNAINFDSEENKSPVARAFSQVMKKMVEGIDPVPRYYYSSRFDDCDWAEEVVFETPSCIGAIDSYKWDSKKYQQVLQEALKNNNIDFRQCRRFQNSRPCNNQECVFADISIQIDAKEDCILDYDGDQETKASFNMKKLYDQNECTVFFGGISTNTNETSSAKGVENNCKVNMFDFLADEPTLELLKNKKNNRPTKIDMLNINLEGYEWHFFENDLVNLWKVDEALLPDQIAFKLYSKYSTGGASQESIKDKGRDEVNDLFLQLSEMGYYVISKTIGEIDRACCEFVVARLNPKSSSSLWRRANDHGCQLKQYWK